jgi:hypothetical protein
LKEWKEQKGFISLFSILGITRKYNSSFKEEDFFAKSNKPPRFAGVPFIPENSIIEKANKVTRDRPVIFKSTDRRLNSEFIN